MEKDWDNEIDSFLRATARREVLSTEQFDTHLDADELSAFAENALPKLVRERYVAHLADCGKCRKTVANLTLFQESEVEEKAFVSVPKLIESQQNTIASAPIVSWIEKLKSLFAIPNLAYASAGLAILLVATFGFIALRSSNNSGEVAGLTKNEIPQTIQETSFSKAEQGAAANVSSNTVANAATVTRQNAFNANSASLNVEKDSKVSDEVSPTSKPENNPIGRIENKANRGPNVSTKDIVALPGLEDRENEPTRSAPAPVTTDAPKTTANEIGKTDEKLRDDAPRAGDKAELKENSTAGAAANSATRNGPSKPIAPSEIQKGPMRNNSQNQTQNNDVQLAKKKSSVAEETRSVGGRSFRNQNGVWIDTNYAGQSQKSIARGSKDYKNLDSNLRAIAENLSGTVIVVSKGKAYKIF